MLENSIHWFSKKAILYLGLFNCFLSINYDMVAQNPGSLQRSICIPNIVDYTILDSIRIIPNSIEISGASSDSTKMSFEYLPYSIRLKHIIESINSDSVCITYRVFKLNFSNRKEGISLKELKSQEEEIYIGYDYTPTKRKKKSDLFAQNGLNYNGSFARGFSLGNNQSLVLNSNLNLQLSGDLGDGISIQAAISDDNLPIQPEGNTQLLQEFDKVFIKVKKDQTEIIAGDYDWRNPDNYFLKYFKKAKGLAVLNTYELSDKTQINSSANYAISRGKFSRQNLETTEGNQGPYKLIGSQNERIIRVLSGSERVFVDGQKLTRGLDNDYIISYDRAEIQFTSRLLITKDSRIIVEFEYSDQNYLRSQYSLNSTIKSDKFGAHFNFYSEQDSKSTSGDIDLDSLDLSALANAGDNIQQAIRPGEFSLSNIETQDQSLYYKVFESSINDSILIFAEDPILATYFVLFSDVGINNGSYSIDVTKGANGRAYQWVGNNNGSFEPVIRIIPPEQKRMMELGGFINISKHSKISGNFALSSNDLNRFSQLNNDDNQGIGTSLNWEHLIPFGTKESGKSIIANAKSEFVNSTFESLNPYRNAEFTRDWNYTDTLSSNEWINDLSVTYNHNKQSQISYKYSRFDRESQYTGDKHTIFGKILSKTWNIDINTSYLSAKTGIENLNFLRPYIKASRSLAFLNNWRTGIIYDAEINKSKELNSSILNLSSYSYHKYGTFIESPYNDNYTIKLGVNKRSDSNANNTDLEQTTDATEIYFEGKWKTTENSNLNWNVTNRNLSITQPLLTNQEPNSTLLGHLDYNADFVNGGIKSITSIDVNSGQEAKSEYEYIKVQNGEGQYIWLDDGDEVEEINEFQIAPLQDTADYVRVTIYNNEFIRTDQTSINQSFRTDFKKLLSNQKAKSLGTKFLKKMSTLSTIRISQKTSSDNQLSLTDRFSFNLNDTSLVSFNQAQNHQLFFNRGKPEYDIQFGYRSNQSKIVFITGFEQSGLQETNSRVRINFNRGLDLTTEFSLGNRSLDSEAFDQNDYQINFIKITPEFDYRPKNNLRFRLGYRFVKNSNTLTNIEKSTSNELLIQATWRKTNKTNISFKTSIVRVGYIGESNTNLELIMLEGLKNGNNFLWNINLTQRLSKNIDLNFVYDGRKTGSAKTIHNAKAQIKANF